MAEAVRPEKKRKKAKKIDKASPKTQRQSPSTKWFVEDAAQEGVNEKSTLKGGETKLEVQAAEESDKGDDTNVANSEHEDAESSKDETLDKVTISLENNLGNKNNDTNEGKRDTLSENTETILEENKEEENVSRREILQPQERVDEDIVVNEQEGSNADEMNPGEEDLVRTENNEDDTEACDQVMEHQDGEHADESFREIESNTAEAGVQDGAANLFDENQAIEKEETLEAEGQNSMLTTEIENPEEIEQDNTDLQDMDLNVTATNVVNDDEGVNEVNHLMTAESTEVAETENSQVILESVTLPAEVGAIQDIPDSLIIPVGEMENSESVESSTQEIVHEQQENLLSIDGLPVNQDNSVREQQTLSDATSQSAERMESMFMQPVQNIAVRTYDYTPSLISQTMPIIPSVGMRHEVLSPFTEEQLKTFYFNPELEQITVFIDQFLQNVNKETHEFYELLNTYCKSRLSFVKVTDEIKTTKQAILSKNDDIWTTKSCKVVGEGHCKDKQLVKQTILYDQVEFHEDEGNQLKKLLKDLRGHVHEEFQLNSYNSQLAKIRIECYIHSLLDGSSFLRSIKTEDSVTAKLPRGLHQDDIRSLTMLQDTISILFSFKRMGEVEEEFCRDVDNWLEKLVSILQRAGALPDYFFILNHLLRCPPLSIAPMAHFIQFPDFRSFNSNEVFDSPLVHHFVVMLATVALPIKERAKFLVRYKHMTKPATKRSMSWTLVDEDREEDENPEESWYLLMENDLVAIFEQFPFEKLFHHLLIMNEVQGMRLFYFWWQRMPEFVSSVPDSPIPYAFVHGIGTDKLSLPLSLYWIFFSTKISGEVSYSAMNSTSNDIMRMLSFTSCVVNLLGQLFDTYNMLRYRQFVKRISRTIRWVVQIVSDHWCAYRSWRIEICGDSDKDIPKFLTVAGQYSLERLQLEFDQFFAKATEQILNSQSVGALQFLASMPYEAISTNAAWSLLNRLVQMPKDEEGIQTQRSRVTTAFGDMNAPGEMVFLLTALSNMAISRSKDDHDFIECVVKSLLEISYTDSATKDFCERDGRDLLAAIAFTHPFVMSPLLSSIGNLAEKLGEGCVYILKALPFNVWIPETKDLEKLRSWLLENPLHSPQHQMAKAVLSKMNFDIKQENGRLFLPQKFHFTIAVMLVEVYGSCVPDGQGGLKNLEYEAGGIISQVGAFAYQSINKILNAQVHDEFLKWCWDVMLSLKLHTSDIVHEDVDEEDQNMLLTFEESRAEENGLWFDNVLRAFEKFNPADTEIEHFPELLNVHRALSTHGVLASYVALSMTKLGHIPEIFMEEGVKLLSRILEAGWVDPVLRIISDVFPQFITRPYLNLLQKDFLQIFDCLVHMDASKAGYTEKIWQYPEPGLYSQKLASIITNHVLVTSKSKTPEDSASIAKFWLSLLTYGQNWYRDFSIQYLLDHMCKVVFFTQEKLDVIVEFLSEKFRKLIAQQSHRGIISSVMSWISTTAPTISFLDIKKQPDYSYYAFAILQVEKEYEENIGIWKSMCAKMAAKPKLLTEMAHKKAISKLKEPYAPTLQNLNIYRWADQGLASNNDHPFLPLIWQQFFMLYLQKQNTEAGLPSRIGVGYRFFDSVSYTSLAKKMRTQLYSIASHHREKSLPKDDGDENSSSVFTDPKSHIHDQTMHSTLASVYQAMALWLEEPRLHDPNLFLDALPEIYKQGDLEKIFQGDKELWLQYVDRNCIEREIDSIASLWTISLNKSSKTKSISRANTTEEMQQMKPTATQRLIKRLNRENKPKPPSAVQESNSPIPEVSMQLLLTRPRFIQELNNDLERVLLFAKRSVVNLDQHTALDEEYYELLCDLYENILKQVVLKISCDVKKHPCTGPAKVTVRYEEKHLKERHARILEENRNVWKTNLSSFMQALPHNLCTGAVYVESVISKLMQSLQYGNESQKMDLENAGIGLFYLVAELINGDVKRNHPAIQFFSSCTEVLGKELIVNNEAEQLRLVTTILSEEASVSFLAPHFNPAAQFRSFLQLYSTTAEAYPETNETTLFVLLTKFDVRAWLSINPSPSECVFMVRTIITAMQKFGKVPAKEVEMLFGLHRTHLLLLLSYRFPQQYSEILRLLAEASDKENLPQICWADFLSYIGCVHDQQSIGSNFERIQLQFNEANETIIWLADFFAEVSRSRYYSNSKMYTAWSQYIPYITKFLLYLFVKTTEPSVANGFSSNLTKERYISSAWNQIFALYRPWIVPHKADRSWPSSHVEQSISMVQSFVESARSLAGFNTGSNPFSIGMNMVWAFYCAEIAAGLKEENSLEIYHGLFATLSWISFCPSVQDLERMLELQIENPPAFIFLGTILCGLDWPTIINQHARHGIGDRLNDFLLLVLRIYVMLSSSRPFILKAKTQFGFFTDAAVKFPWQFIRPQDIDAICGWFAENSDPIYVLMEDVYLSTVLRMLKTTCVFVKPCNQSEGFQGANPENCLKQNSYINMIVKLISRAADKQNFLHHKLDSIIPSLLTDIQKSSCLRAGTNDELISLLSTFLTLLNSVSNSQVLTIIETLIHKFISETNEERTILCMLSAGCRMLASLEHVVTLSEKAIESFFTRQSDADFSEVWTKVLQVLLIPDLNQDEFVRKALTKQCLLTLYAYNLHRLSICSGPEYELPILNETLQWCFNTPPSPLCSEKSLLIWWQIMNCIKRQVFTFTQTSQHKQLSKNLQLFANYLQQTSEDKSYSGILGAIGFGKKSSFSPQFRLVARSLQVFILAQMPSGTTLRSFPDAPGDVKGENKKELATQEAKNALQSLKSLKKNKSYISMKEEIKWMSEFMLNPKSCLLNGPDLLLYICDKLFCKVSFIVGTLNCGNGTTS